MCVCVLSHDVHTNNAKLERKRQGKCQATETKSWQACVRFSVWLDHNIMNVDNFFFHTREII